MISVLQNSSICRVPDAKNECVYKDECLYCFKTPEDQNGLYICMTNFIGLCKDHLELYYQKSNFRLYLNLKIEKRLLIDVNDQQKDDLTQYQKLLKEAYSYEKTDFKENHSLILMPYEEVNIDDDLLPDHVKMSVSQILAADSLSKASERAAKADDGFDASQYIFESKFAANLQQLDNGVKIPPSGWKCYKCEKTKNLWLNLTDGTILCGRRNSDGTGGNNHALEHYEITRYPLAVKLGTISPESADVFSYEEDDMVRDPLLPAHLAHFGIDIMNLTKTDQTMEELEMENLRQSRERSNIMESDRELELLCGPSLTGIVNTGNSCYMNSVLQTLTTIPAFEKFYANRFEAFKWKNPVLNDLNDFRLQFSKLGHYLKAGDYSFLPPEPAKKDGELIPSQPGIVPLIFRLIVGKGHKEFSTKQQQDVNEFLMHLFNLIERDIKKNKDGNEIQNPLESVAFKLEDRLFCEEDKKYNYKFRKEYILSLPIPMDKAENQKEIDEMKQRGVAEKDIPKPSIKLETCLENFVTPNLIEGYVDSSTNQTKTAFQTNKLENFPDYLWIQTQRFSIGQDWRPIKLDVEIEVPDNLNLELLRGNGHQPGEELMDDSESMESNNVKPVIYIDEAIVEQMVNMGFPINACKKAVYLTNNRSADDAANWLMTNIGEPGFDDLPPELKEASESIQTIVIPDDTPLDQGSIDMMMSMGFTKEQATKALQETDGNLERAADWAFTHPEELNQSAGAVADEPRATKQPFNYSDGTPNYKLIGMISHMGSNPHVGHYVAHVKQDDGSWVLFNDEKVQKSLSPPTKLAYMYLYQRCADN